MSNFKDLHEKYEYDTCSEVVRSNLCSNNQKFQRVICKDEFFSPYFSFNNRSPQSDIENKNIYLLDAECERSVEKDTGKRYKVSIDQCLASNLENNLRKVNTESRKFNSKNRNINKLKSSHSEYFKNVNFVELAFETESEDEEKLFSFKLQEASSKNSKKRIKSKTGNNNTSKEFFSKLIKDQNMACDPIEILKEIIHDPSLYKYLEFLDKIEKDNISDLVLKNEYINLKKLLDSSDKDFIFKLFFYFYSQRNIKEVSLPSSIPFSIPFYVSSSEPSSVPNYVPSCVPSCVPSSVPSCVPNYVPYSLPILQSLPYSNSTTTKYSQIIKKQSLSNDRSAYTPPITQPQTQTNKQPLSNDRFILTPITHPGISKHFCSNEKSTPAHNSISPTQAIQTQNLISVSKQNKLLNHKRGIDVSDNLIVKKQKPCRDLTFSNNPKNDQLELKINKIKECISDIKNVPLYLKLKDLIGASTAAKVKCSLSDINETTIKLFSIPDEEFNVYFSTVRSVRSDYEEGEFRIYMSKINQ